MSLADLKPGSLNVLLFIRTDPPEKDNFHWALYLHKNAAEGGTKLHITGSEASGWITDHGPVGNIFKSFLLVGLFRIADIQEGLEGHVNQTIRTYDGQINKPGMTCRVWVFWVLEPLTREENGYTVLKCNDFTALEREIKDWGNIEAPAAARNEQPRVLAASRICGL